MQAISLTWLSFGEKRMVNTHQRRKEIEGVYLFAYVALTQKGKQN